MRIPVAIDEFGVRRALGMTVALGLLLPAAQAWGDPVATPGTGIASILLTGSLLVLVCLFACADGPARLERLEPWLLVAGLMTLMVLAGGVLAIPSGYPTDDAGFLHGAAETLKAGHDPYAANLTWAIKQFGFQPTVTADGSSQTFYAYPSLSLLVTLPLVELRSTTQVAVIAEVVSLAIATVILFRLLPTHVRALAPLVCVALPLLLDNALGGVSEVMLVPLLIVVANRWRDVGRDGELGRHGLGRAVALGLAASTNQLSWFLIPFIVCGTAMTHGPELGLRRSVRVAVRYAGVVAGVFIVLNVGFFAWNPDAWARDIFAGFIRPQIPAGQGLASNLTLFAHFGGGNLSGFGPTLVLCYAALLAIYLLRFDRLHTYCFVLPSLALWLGDRSMMGYFIIPAVAVLVAAVNGGDVPKATAWALRLRSRPRLSALAVISAFLPATAAMAATLSAPAPLSISLVSASGKPGTQFLGRITIVATNHSDTALTPHFQTDSNGQASDFWQIRQGPRRLAAGASGTYVLSSTGANALVPVGTAFTVQVVTADPDTVSSARVSTRSAG